MSHCTHMQSQFSHYLDGDMPGTQMLELTRHLEECSLCAGEFTSWQRTQQMVTALGASKAPADLALRLRVAISQERQRTPREWLGRWTVRWKNSFQPVLLRAAGGFASAVILVGTAGLLVSTFAAPEPVEARDQPLRVETSPRFVYSTFEPEQTLGEHDNPLILQVFVDGHGRAYDYNVLSGQMDAATRISIDNVLLFSVFEPARSFDQPVRGTTVMSFVFAAMERPATRAAGPL